MFVVVLRNNRNYVLYQAMRRIWRPFAPLPVEIYFPVYSGTAEEMILDLVGEKMLNNHLLTSQEDGGALVPDDTENILQVAVNRLLKGVRLKQVQGIFTTQNAITASPLGSPTASSPEVKTTLALVEWGAKNRCLVTVKNIRKTKAIPQAQLGLPLLQSSTKT